MLRGQQRCKSNVFILLQMLVNFNSRKNCIRNFLFMFFFQIWNGEWHHDVQMLKGPFPDYCMPYYDIVHYVFTWKHSSQVLYQSDFAFVSYARFIVYCHGIDTTNSAIISPNKRICTKSYIFSTNIMYLKTSSDINISALLKKNGSWGRGSLDGALTMDRFLLIL